MARQKSTEEISGDLLEVLDKLNIIMMSIDDPGLVDRLDDLSLDILSAVGSLHTLGVIAKRILDQV